jgi:integrase
VTLLIEMERRGVGRLRVRSGTTKTRTYKAMLDMLNLLYENGRADILRDIKEQRVKVMDVYEKFRAGRLDQLPTGDLMRPLEAAWLEWLAGKEIAELTRHDYEEAWKRLGAGPGAPMTGLPDLLREHRKASMKVRARSFNKDRAAFLAFLNGTLGDSHWLHAACKRVATLKVPTERKMPYNPQTVEQIRALAGKLPVHHALTLWGLCLTGMRPEEMFEERGNAWSLEAELVRVKGTKSPAADRVVPRVGLIVKPRTGRLAFYRALRAASSKTVTPYDCRRTYAQWMDLGRIPQFRQDFYFGHGPKDLAALYKRMRECLPYIREDAAALEALVGVGEPQLKVMA